MPKQDNRMKAFVKPQGGYSSSSYTTSFSSTTGWRSSDFFFVRFVLFFLNVIVFIFLSSIVVFMDYYTTIVEGCFEGGDGGCGGKGGAVGYCVIHKQEINPARREQKSLSWDKLW